MLLIDILVIEIDFIKQLENRFLIDKKFTIEKVKEFENFWKFLRTKISIVMIKTTDFKTRHLVYLKF